ncbi:Group 2 glycosyl transferase [Oenococcus oeni]|uniref:Group 2 glycosyl transferase n=1 Tax=Oenococcus oeni TaxID=1247 RepID=A0AAQ2ZET7_OENOE|nr:glycosyltransferase [Oenococcus oeni]SYW05278.1 Group 2 glycosyl transferase [Oenococcus oeni]VDB98779.1 Group 2 glycosyl transferase [Oenococcus oeni]
MNETLMILSLISIWIALFISLFILFSAALFWFKYSRIHANLDKLNRYPTVTIVVPAHNEESVIAQTAQAILNLNYPVDKVELLIFADNCRDRTLQVAHSIVDQQQYSNRSIKIIDHNHGGKGGKAKVLNDALKIAHGEYICVYDADAIPEKNALYFLVKKVLENPNKFVSLFGRNKTRNAEENFLTKCINQEIVVTHRVEHVGLWHMFKIGRIPGTNFIIRSDFIRKIGGWSYGALTEDTDISFKILQNGKLIALAYDSEAFEQEPETLKDYYFQRKRWIKGNYQVVISNFRHLFDRSNWRVKFLTLNYFCTFFWFVIAIIVSDIIFASNFFVLVFHPFLPYVDLPFAFNSGNIQISQLLLFNWFLMVLIYLNQISFALSTQFGQTRNEQIWIALASYFTYSQLFILISISAFSSLLLDKILHRDGTKWVKSKRFTD